jgi:AcrR family transcriptional regulator
MGRPRKYRESTAEALLQAAERLVETEGLEALTVRRVADAVGTTTRAVYTLYGSKDALVVALGGRAFDLLRIQIEGLPATADPAADLVEAGVAVFRHFAINHPALFRIGVQRTQLKPGLAAGFRDPAREALAGLAARIERLEEAGLLGERAVPHAVNAFHALCEGLAAMELRSLLPAAEAEQIWRDGLTALVRGFATTAPRARRR